MDPSPSSRTATRLPTFSSDAGLILTGLLQGLSLWALWYAAKNSIWPATSSQAMLAIAYAAIAAPLAIYWTADSAIGRMERIAGIVACAALFAAIGMHQGGSSLAGIGKEYPGRYLGDPGLFGRSIAAFVGGVMLVHLWACRKKSYERYFSLTWHNAVASALAVAFAAIVWMMLFAGAWLLQTVKIDAVRTLLAEPWFALPVTTTAVSFGIVMAVRWPSMRDSARRFWLILNAYLLPVALAFGVVWVIAIPFAGLAGATGKPFQSFMLLWYVALCVYFLNTAWQDGRQFAFSNRFLLAAVRWLWLAVLAVASVVVWSIAIRVRQHGWTEERIWSALVAALAMIYAVGYALPARGGTWMAMVGRVNVFAACVASVAIVAMLTPLADARRLAVTDQMSRLRSGAIDPMRFDYRFLRLGAGRYGREALDRLAAGEPFDSTGKVADLANQERSKPDPWNNPAAQTSPAQTSPAQMSPAQTGPGHPKVTPKTIAEVRRRIEVWPAGATVYADFFELFLMPYADDREKHCLDPEWHCGVWQQDLDGDSTDEVLLLQMGPYRANDRLLLYGRDGKSFTRLGMAVIPRLEFFDDWRKALATERPKTERQRWPDLKIDGHQITIVTGAAQY